MLAGPALPQRAHLPVASRHTAAGPAGLARPGQGVPPRSVRAAGRLVPAVRPRGPRPRGPAGQAASAPLGDRAAEADPGPAARLGGGVRLSALASGLVVRTGAGGRYDRVLTRTSGLDEL